MLLEALTQNFLNCKQRTLELSGYGELPGIPRESVPPFAGSPDIPEDIIRPDASARFGGTGLRNPSRTWRRGSGDLPRYRERYRSTTESLTPLPPISAAEQRKRGTNINAAQPEGFVTVLRSPISVRAIRALAFFTISPQFDAGVVRTHQPKVFCDPMMETGDCRKGKMIGSKEDRMNPRIGCGLQQLLAREIPT